MPQGHDPEQLLSVVLQRSQEVLAILDAIEAAESFSATPTRPDDRARHQTGVALLSLMQRQVRELSEIIAPYLELPTDAAETIVGDDVQESERATDTAH